jgi:hypothetical protein
VKKASTVHNLAQGHYGRLAHYQQLPEELIGYVAAVAHETNSHSATKEGVSRHGVKNQHCILSTLSWESLGHPSCSRSSCRKTGPQLSPQSTKNHSLPLALVPSWQCVVRAPQELRTCLSIC